ncbi:purine hydroxylase beta subunit apoprotein [Dethiosulfatibacter aminovorans DSM 17477]|uniref:Purine hydroxylase beta subunit apoprotein n=1 Tax=Dethiosulfatibacter aminovorans DSM 17477 TaxID=1121476 RepID=A0A1M6A6A7_9FIRM|nr:molybdopterin cofactor-binding domain-containing protein [Dethiosulfatibacter aminovorans]SHI32032.1 purine hydroxylase beta subunit apoprotein [Dethiosulfatibacter aminovorans DSM 17477]
MIKKGTGVGCMWYGIGNTGLPNPAAAFVEVHADGSVTVLAGVADIGQGSDTVMAQITAETLGVTFDKVVVRSADSGVTPEGGATSASRQTYISGNACHFAALEARDNIIKVAAELLNCSEKDIILKDNKASVKGDEEKSIAYTDIMMGLKARGLLALGKGQYNPSTIALDGDMQGTPYETYAYATQIAEVEVNTETGEVKVVNIVCAHDVGQAINKRNIEGQIEGGVAMGIGFALTEKVDIKDGIVKNADLNNYIIQTTQDMPEIHSIVVEDPSSTGPYGAKGVGEPALVPVAPAILNAIYDAVGVRITHLPATADVVLKAIKEKEGK